MVASDRVVYLCEGSSLDQVGDFVLLVDDEPVPEMLCVASGKGVITDEMCLLLQ